MRSHRVQTLPPAELASLQLTRLQNQVGRLYDRLPFYRRRMDALGVRPGDITTLADITRLPFTSKADLREGFPWGLVAADRDDIVETHMSSGTTGKPVVDAYTRGDLATWREVMARTLDMGGVGRSDIVQVAYGYGLFTGGFGAHYGAEALGAMVLPISSGNTHRQLTTMMDFGTTVLCCTPSYALYLAEYAREHGFTRDQFSVRAGFFGAEPWSATMRAQIEDEWGIKAYDIYGLTELIGPGVGSECEAQDGLHLFDDHFYPEVVDPETGVPVPVGEKGELVLTALTREGTSVLRYRTRDVTYIIDEPCACGRTSTRVHRLMGRTDDMLIIRGVNIFPSQIEDVLLRARGVVGQYQLVVDRDHAMDSLEVRVEMDAATFRDNVGSIVDLERRIESALKGELGIQATCVLVNPKSIVRSEGKAKRIIDRREVTTHV